MTWQRLWVLAGLAVVAWTASGCNSILNEDENDSMLPQSQPAQWEGQIPGMPSSGGTR